jgi:hypothetical protein
MSSQQTLSKVVRVTRALRKMEPPSRDTREEITGYLVDESGADASLPCPGQRVCLRFDYGQKMPAWDYATSVIDSVIYRPDGWDVFTKSGDWFHLREP